MNKRGAVGNIRAHSLSDASDEIVVQNERVKTKELGNVFDARDGVVREVNDVILVLGSSKVLHHGNLQSSDIQLTLLQRIVERSRMADRLWVQSHLGSTNKQGE